MANISINEVDNKNLWEDFLVNRGEATFLQSWHWGEFQTALKKQVYKTGFYKGRKLNGIMLSVVEDAKRGRYLTVPGGPIIDWESSDAVVAFLEEIKRIAALEKCIFVRVRPQLRADDFSKNLFRKNGFINAPMHLHAELTSVLDITRSEVELLATMRKGTRYEIKRALSLGIRIKATDDLSAIHEFYELQHQTAMRQKFIPFSRAFITEQFRVFSSAGKALLYSAEYQCTMLAQAFIIFYGHEATYHYGASTEFGKQYPGAYLIQWEVIKEAKRRGLSRYNFWGITREHQEDHRYYGVSVFKRGFGGTVVEYLHAQDLVISKPKYLVSAAIEHIRKKVRAL